MNGFLCRGVAFGAVVMVSFAWIGCHSAVLPASGETSDGTRPDSARPDDGHATGDAGSEDAEAPATTVDGGGPEADGETADQRRPRFVPGGADVSPESLDRVLAALRDATSAAARDAVVREVAWHAGWPLSDGVRILFVTRWDEAEANVEVVGDFNDWAPSDTPVMSSPPHHWTLQPAPAVLAGQKYKWRAQVDGRTAYRAGPEATRYGYDQFGAFGYLRAPTDARYLERFPDLSSLALPLGRTVRVSVPAGFAGGDAPRLLLMHDGQNVFAPDAPHGGWAVTASLASPDFDDVLVLAVDSVADRRAVYTHVPEDLSPDDGRVNPEGGRADDYLELLRDELLPWFEGHYGVTLSASRTLVAGSSLGGLVSLYLVQRAPALFGHVVAMSPAVGWGRLVNETGVSLIDVWPERVTLAGHGIYLDSGGGVPEGRANCADPAKVDYRTLVHADFYCSTLSFKDALLERGYEAGRDLRYVHVQGAPHDESAWRARLPEALKAAQGMGWRRASR